MEIEDFPRRQAEFDESYSGGAEEGVRGQQR